MELKLLNEQGQAASTLQASDVLFGREYNEALVHQVVTAYAANARSGNRKQKGRSEIAKSTRKPFRQKGTGNARAGMASSPLWRGGGKIFPNTPDENFSQKVNRKMYRAGVAAILSQLAREDRLAVVESFSIEAPKTRLLSQKLKGMGLDSVLVITDGVAGAVPEGAGHQGRAGEDGGSVAMSAITQERLLQVLLAPQISEKATFIADKNEQVVFKVSSDATKPEVKAAVESLFKVEVKSVQILNVKGKAKRFGKMTGRRKDWKKAFVCLKPGQEINFAVGE